MLGSEPEGDRLGMYSIAWDCFVVCLEMLHISSVTRFVTSSDIACTLVCWWTNHRSFGIKCHFGHFMLSLAMTIKKPHRVDAVFLKISIIRRFTCRQRHCPDLRLFRDWALTLHREHRKYRAEPSTWKQAASSHSGWVWCMALRRSWWKSRQTVPIRRRESINVWTPYRKRFRE